MKKQEVEKQMEISKADFKNYLEAINNGCCKKNDITGICNSTGLPLRKVYEISKNIDLYSERWSIKLIN